MVISVLFMQSFSLLRLKAISKVVAGTCKN